MRRINIKAVKDGMVLAEPLKNAHGSLLLGKGTSLTEVFAARLAQRGVVTVCVEGEPEAAEENVSAIHASDIQTVPLEKLFEDKIVNNSMKMIYEALIRNKESGGRL